MHSQDITNHDNNRSDAIDKLLTFCIDNGWSYHYTEKTFTVDLPEAEPIPTVVEQNLGNVKLPGRKSFNTDTWGPKSYVEGEEPDPSSPLTEGEPPKETL